MSTPARVRFAPSPTGQLHVGGARTAIYNWALARRTGGVFILRIDDTDPERSTDENVQAILRGLRWMGLDWDEGPEVGGAFGPYFQTQRSDTYADGLATMRAEGHAYPCFCTSEELVLKRDAARLKGGFAGYDGTCRSMEPETVAARLAAGEPHVWRLSVPEGRTEVAFDDAIRGHMSFPADALDDFVLVRTDGTPTYNYATVVDDALMEITHIVRGDDHLSNTPRQILVFEALGHDVPVFGHLPMIWGPDGKRLSKRHGAASVEAYRDEGFLPEAVLNYLALLGWSLDGETTIISAEMLCDSFSLDRVSSNPAILDTDKLEWMNGAYIRELDADGFVAHMIPWLVEAGLTTVEQTEAQRSWLLQLAPLVSERIKRLDEIVPMVRFLFMDTIEIEPAVRAKALESDSARAALAGARELLSKIPDFEAAPIEAALRAVPEISGAKPKVVFLAVRVAATGTTVSPPLWESLELLGRERTLRRLDAALADGVDDPATHP